MDFPVEGASFHVRPVRGGTSVNGHRDSVHLDELELRLLLLSVARDSPSIQQHHRNSSATVKLSRDVLNLGFSSWLPTLFPFRALSSSSESASPSSLEPVAVSKSLSVSALLHAIYRKSKFEATVKQRPSLLRTLFSSLVHGGGRLESSWSLSHHS
ncbi:hypothetical protein Bca4012_063482 [Brassica carinata]|uniref:Uncharacterized protein n=1 Tax=Brassica carinata TaxID=52824 RepID=A0A8X7V5R6_BRACI|nr:hypothetical protein Bca52824_033091 [Brassica carinata]